MSHALYYYIYHYMHSHGFFTFNTELPLYIMLNLVNFIIMVLEKTDS